MGVLTSHVAFQHTATDDLPFRLASYPVPYYEATFFISSKDALIGDGATFTGTLAAGGSYNDKIGDVSDVFFKNATAGQNCTVKCFATVPTQHVQDALRVGGVLI
jgi:hypothetical protein